MSVHSSRIQSAATRAAFPWIRGDLIASYLIFFVVIFLISRLINFEAISNLDFGVVWKYRLTFFNATMTTLLSAGVAVICGLCVGTIFAIISLQGPRPLKILVTVYVEIWRNTPLVVQLFWVHFALPSLTGISTTAFQSGLLAMVMQSSAYLTDIARAGVQAVPRGQFEAAIAAGLPTWSRWFDIILPQALRIVIPPLATIAIGYFKASAVLSLLSVSELMYQSNTIATYTHKPIEVITTAGIIYWTLGFGFGAATRRLEAVLGKGRTR